MTYFTDMSELTQVAISNDLTKIVLANGNENYIFKK